MAIPKVVEDINAIDENLRPLYVQSEEGGYRLDVDDTDVSKLKSKNNEFKAEKMKLANENRELKSMIEKLSEAGQNHGQNEDVVNSMKKRIDELTKQADEERRLRDEHDSKYMLEKEVTRLGERLFGNKAKLFKNNLESMFKVENVNGQKILGIVGKDGQVDYTRSVEDLERELKSPGSDYADFIIASNASGSGVRPGSTTTFNPHSQKGPIDYRQKFVEDAKKKMPGLN